MVDKSELLDFLEILDKNLERPIEIIAVGGTAMTLLGIKTSTIDIDFEVKPEEYPTLKKGLSILPHGYRVDIFTGGLIFSQQLPDNYREKSVPIKHFKNIRLLALHPIDIVVTKIGRLNERDKEDIKSCIEKFDLTKEQIRERAQKVEYAGKEELYEDSLEHVIKLFFGGVK